MALVIGPSRNPVVQAAFAALRGKPAPAVPLAIPKAEPAKPGKGAPTKAERAWLDWIVEYGCVACRADGQAPRPSAPHHILRGGRRMGHRHSIPLCDPGHHQGGQPLGMVSRHPDKARFEKRYGTEQELLAFLRKKYGETP